MALDECQFLPCPIIFLLEVIHLGKAWIHLFSSKLWVVVVVVEQTALFNLGMATSLGEVKL